MCKQFLWDLSMAAIRAMWWLLVVTALGMAGSLAGIVYCWWLDRREG